MTGRFNDPRWNQAAGITDAISGDVDFRALYYGGKIYLSWEVKFDPGGLEPGTLGALNGDAILIGIKTGSQTALIRVVLKAPTPQLGDAAVIAHATQMDMDIKIQEWNAVNGWIAPTSAWFDHAAVWDSMVTTEVGWWSFAMVLSSKIGTTTSYQDGDTFHMWYTYLVYTSPDVSNAPVEYHFPWGRTNNIIVQQPDGTNAPDLLNAPQPDDPLTSPDWGEFTVKTVTTGCAGDVALDRAQIGTIESGFATPSSEIKLTSSNQFVARPTNLHSDVVAGIAANTITARFYLANWGSVPDVSTVWKEISPTPPHSNDALIPGNNTTAHGDQTDPTRNDIHFDWSTGADRCRYDPSCGGRKHQCLLVELSGGQLIFRNKSAYRNMDFVPGSRFERQADISIVGLQALAGRPTRDVYFYLETVNMPTLTDGAPGAQAIVVADTQFISGTDTTAMKGRTRVRMARDAIAYIRVDTISLPSGNQGGRAQALNAALAKGLLTEHDIDPLMPTYRVHVYHATADSFTVRGKRVPVLRAQSSFGYWVDHKGSLSGWTAKLKGAGLEHISGRWYRLAVPNDSFAVVNSVIKAIGVKPFALSLHGGVTLPTGALKTAAKSGFGVTADLEHRLNRTFSIALLFGFHRFDSVATSGHLDVQHFSGSLQTTVGAGVTRLMFDAGGGTYTFKPGATKPGAHAGAGVAIELSPYVGLSAHVRTHRVFTGGSGTNFVSIQVGGRARF